MKHLETMIVRFSDCDAQGIVYNANYFRFIDDAFDGLLRRSGLKLGELEWDVVLRKAEIEWRSSLTIGETFEIEFEMSRIGNTSFDMTYKGRGVLPHPPARGSGAVLDGYPREVFVAVVQYVGIDDVSRKPKRMPDWLLNMIAPEFAQKPS